MINLFLLQECLKEIKQQLGIPMDLKNIYIKETRGNTVSLYILIKPISLLVDVAFIQGGVPSVKKRKIPLEELEKELQNVKNVEDIFNS